jgi:hypothetical protein
MTEEYASIVMKAPVVNVGTLSEFKRVVNAPITQANDFAVAFANLSKPDNGSSSVFHL